MTLSLEELKTDRETLLKEFEEAQKMAVLTNPNVQRLQGAINYIDSCIKRIESQKGGE